VKSEQERRIDGREFITGRPYDVRTDFTAKLPVGMDREGKTIVISKGMGGRMRLGDQFSDSKRRR
jgi:hypothetical protein